MTERRVFLCALEELPDGASRGFTVDTAAGVQDIFVVHKNRQVVAYHNSCPHTGGPLDWVPDQFLSLDRSEIQCATHDARFRIDDGVCIAGPCAGKRLSPVRAVVVKGAVYAELPVWGRAGDQ